ncbi:MAG: peptidylprolyl isomerase [Candidatus Pacearchaeota archaeon]
METIKKDDFVEIKFTGRVRDSEIFDTNIEEDAEKIGLKIEKKPFIICIGQRMVIEGLDKELDGKEIGKKYNVILTPKESFGERRRELINLIPMKAFAEKNVFPKPGMTLTLDNHLVRIVSVSGGRVLVDFNNPLAGKEIVYDFIIKRKIDNLNEKIDSLLNYFIYKNFMKEKIDFKLIDGKVVFETDKFFTPLIEMIGKKFSDILGVEFSITEI